MVAVAVYVAKLLPQDRTKKLLIFILFVPCFNYYFSDDAQILIESHFSTIFFYNYTVCKFATCPQQFCQLQFSSVEDIYALKKPICAPCQLSEVSPTSPLKPFHCLSAG